MFFFIKERNQLFRTGPHLSSGAISVLHRPAELGALYGTLSSLKYPSWRVRTPHEGEALCTLQNFSGVKFRRHGADDDEASAVKAAAAAAAARVTLT
ncbi:PREDICTED: uncharacterized protein MIR205HG isoform X1 [Mandrillus leucophaeus]|uniref:uncharacterized protein MIR205HG isoform X1 n=1 Tax=Mandrillus leucophaeus TaxID=9568 RepID=UPI0005F4B559|nr:PREDICTED: uncharacterized protein MIR205HG isoform X1 [Mandrillus leucophaeus]